MQEREELMSKVIFVNLPVRNLVASTAFYEALGGNWDAGIAVQETLPSVGPPRIPTEFVMERQFDNHVKDPAAAAPLTGPMLVSLRQLGFEVPKNTSNGSQAHANMKK